jgi:hypothetical protein
MVRPRSLVSRGEIPLKGKRLPVEVFAPLADESLGEVDIAVPATVPDDH